MKYLIYSLFFLFIVTLHSCGSDDDAIPEPRYISQTLRTDQTYTVPGGFFNHINSSNTFVASITNTGLIQPNHVGVTTIEAFGNDLRYVYTIYVTPTRDLLNDLGDCIGKPKTQIEQRFGGSISNTGYNYLYTPSKLEKEIQIRYSKDYTADYGILTFDKKYNSEISELLSEYYAFYKLNGNYTIYINSNTFDNATILLARSQSDKEDRIIYMTPSMYTLIEDIIDIFPIN